MLKRVAIRREEYRTSSELFAITADAYHILGHIKREYYRCENTDSHAAFSSEEEAKSRISAMRRLARVVCSDLEEIDEDSAVSIAEQVKEAQIEELIDSMTRIKKKYGLKTVVSVGIGDFIVKEAADSLNMNFLSLSSVYDKKISAVFPAYAVAKLLETQ